MSYIVFNAQGGGTPGSDLRTLTGNTGGAISGDASYNINLLGAGSVTVTGSGNTLTITDGGLSSTQFDTDSGSAVPSSNIIQIIGGTNITTSGAGNTVTINASADLEKNYTSVNTSPYVVLAADEYIGVDSSGGAIQINLPNAPSTGRVYTIKDSTGSAASFNITVTTVGGSVNIDGATTFVMNTAYQAVNLIFSGTAYEIY